jgi:hypothetical protein
LESCAGGFCLNGQVLGLGSTDTPAGGDLNGDGTTDSRGAELTSLVGSVVTVTVDRTASGWVLVAVNGRQY